MHVVYVTPEFMTEGTKAGGLATYINNIAHIVRNKGNKVTIVALSNRNNMALYWENGIIIERVNIQRIELSDIPHVLKIIYKSHLVNRRIKEINAKDRIDIIQYANFGALGLLQPHNVKTVTRLSSDSVLWRIAAEYEFNYRDNINKLNIVDLMENIATKRSDKVFAPSKVVANLVSARIHKPIRVIESPFYLDKDNWDWKLYYRSLEGKKYFLMHTSLSRAKGVHLVGQILYKILHKYQDLKFVIAGNDYGIALLGNRKMSAVKYLKKCAGDYKDRVIYLSTLKRNQLYPIIQQSLFCIQPSRVDNLPNACIEAMAMKKIVIGAYGASYEQLIQHKESGLLFKREDAVSLYRAVEYVMHMSEQNKEIMGQKAYNRAQEMSDEKIYQKLMKLYEKCMV